MMAIASRPGHWRLVAPLAVVVALALLWSGYWLWGSAKAHGEVVRVQADLARQGLDIACASKSHGGFPFRFSYTCRGIEAAGSTGWRASAETLDVLAQSWDPGHLIVRLTGPLRIVAPAGETWTVTHKPAIASLKLRRAGAQGSLLAEQVMAQGPGSDILTVKRLNLHVRLPEADLAQIAVGAAQTVAPDMVVVATGLDLTRPQRRALRLDSLEAEATLTALPVPFAPTLEENLRAIGAAGGTLRLDRLVATAESVDVDASGSVGIGADGLPEGRITMRFSDIKLLFARLAERDLITRKAADGATVVVGLLTAAGTSQGLSGPVDLRFKDGAIFWGPFRIADHGPLF